MGSLADKLVYSGYSNKVEKRGQKAMAQCSFEVVLLNLDSSGGLDETQNMGKYWQRNL